MEYRSLLIGAPVYRREWIIRDYLEYADAAARLAGFEPQYLFVGEPDDPTMALIREWTIANGRQLFLKSFEQDYQGADHAWNDQRYEFMATLRNVLLEQVRVIKPDLFLSLDTDILIHKEAIVSALEGIGRFDAVGMKAYMSHGTDAPNYALTYNGGMHRPDQHGFFPVDVIMAAKLMTSTAYNVDYSPHHNGEDVGWSKNCQAAGVKLGYDGRVCSKHLLEPTAVYAFDKRVGW